MISLVFMAAGACDRGHAACLSHGSGSLVTPDLMLFTCDHSVISLKISSRENGLTYFTNGFKNSLLDIDVQLLKLREASRGPAGCLMKVVCGPQAPFETSACKLTPAPRGVPVLC